MPTSARRPDSAPSQTDSPARPPTSAASSPAPQRAQGLPIGWEPHAGADSFPARRLCTAQRGALDQGAGSEGVGEEADAGSQPRPRIPLRVLPWTPEEEAATGRYCEGRRARAREGRARTSRDPISRRQPARKPGESAGRVRLRLRTVGTGRRRGLSPATRL